MRNQIWENLHPISHLASEKWEVGSKREFSFLKPYPQERLSRKLVCTYKTCFSAILAAIIDGAIIQRIFHYVFDG